MLPWTEIDAEKWFDVPTGAIVVIDECQRIFRPRSFGGKVPEHVERLETHRHQGIDLFLITQHPTLADTNVRKLVGRHVHLVRRFGLARSTMLDYASCKENPLASTASGTRIEWAYPKEVYSYYKSAELHTQRVRIPMKLVMLFVVPLLVVAAIVYEYQRMKSRMEPEHVAPGQTGVVAGPGQLAPSSKPGRVTTAEYLGQMTPRVAGLAYTAPVYDKVTEPVRAPVPAACVEMKSRGCRCYSEQGTLLDMPEELCRGIVKTGYYVSWENDREAHSRRASAGEAQPPLAAQRAEPVAFSDPVRGARIEAPALAQGFFSTKK